MTTTDGTIERDIKQEWLIAKLGEHFGDRPQYAMDWIAVVEELLRLLDRWDREVPPPTPPTWPAPAITPSPWRWPITVTSDRTFHGSMLDMDLDEAA